MQPYCTVSELKMARWILHTLSLLAASTALATELPADASDGEKAVYCFSTNNLRMQLGAAVSTDPGQAAEMFKAVERWQNIIQRELPDFMAQQKAQQTAMMQLSERIKSVRRDPGAMVQQVINPIMAECDVLLAQLDISTASASATPAPPEPVTAPSGPYDSDVFAGLVQETRYADFRWNHHSDLYARVEGRGQFRRIRNGFRLEFETRIKTLCVGDLIESRRSDDGYLMHLKVPAGSGEGCLPRVTRGVLFPMAFDEQPKNRRLMLRLYDDQNRLVTAMRFESRELQAKRLDPQKLMVMDEVVYAMEKSGDEQRRAGKLARLRAEPDFPRLKPFYDSCMGKAPETPHASEASYYCICMTYKFGVGERIPESEFQSYVQDFSRLTRQFQIFTEDNKLYTRLAEECRACSYADRTLRAGCDAPDTAMLLPNTFAELIGQLEKDVLRLESSEFYKENFFVIYLQGYSGYCLDEIDDPVPFDYVVTETTTDQYGSSYSDEVQRDRTYVPRRHAARYQAIYDKHAKMTPEKFAGAIGQMAVTSDADLRQLRSDTSARVRIETEKRIAVRDHLAKGCTSAPVQRVYSRLDALFE